MLDDPGRIDAHVVGHHVTGQADAAPVTAVAQGDVGGLSAQVVGDAVVVERIGGGDGVLIAAQLLDGFGGAAALPDADEPERIQTAARQFVQVFVGNLIEAVDGAAVFAGELGEPDVGAFGDQHGGGHPVDVGAELFVLVGGIAEDRNIGVAGQAGPLLRARSRGGGARLPRRPWRQRPGRQLRIRGWED